MVTNHVPPRPISRSAATRLKRQLQFSQSMPESFDAYYTWLGVPPEEQPADFYRLLGLARFEENREVISNAADQRMAHIRSFQGGPHARDSQKVLNELSKAAGCLLNPRRKAMYDQHLRSSLRAAQQEQALMPPTADDAVAVSIQVDSRSGTKPPPRRHADRKRLRIALVWLTLGGIAATAIAIAAVMFYSDSRQAAVSVTNKSAGSSPDQPINAALAAKDFPKRPESTTDLKTSSTSGSTDPSITKSGTNQELNPSAKPASAAETGEEPKRDTAKELIAPASTPVPATSTDKPAATLAAAADPPLSPVVPGKSKALRFRTNDRIEIANTVSLIDLRKPFTVELWVRFSPGDYAHWLCGDLIIGPNHPDVSSGAVAGWQLFIQQTVGGQHRVAVSTREGYARDFPVSENQWRHIAFCNDTKQASVFVDGRRSATGTVDLLARSFTPSPIPLHIGSHGFLHTNQPPGLTGDLKAFRVSSTARYAANFTPAANLSPEPDTEVLLDFEKASETKLPDLSGHGRDGTIHGARWFGLDESPSSTSVAATSTPPSTAPATSAPVPSVPPAALPASPKQQAIPEEVAVIKAREQVRRVFQEEFKKAKEAKELLALADKLMALAAESSDDVASRYVMMDEAQKLASQSGDLSKTLSLIDDFARYFDVDFPKLKSAAVEKAADLAKSSVDRRQVAENAVAVADQLVMAGRFDLATDMVQAAITQAGRAKEVELSKSARELRDEINHAKKALNDAQQAQTQLASDADNGDLNLRWGRFVCFHQRNWEKGLPYLAKGSNQILASAAKLDLAQPPEPEKQAAVGQAWVDALKAVEANEKNAVLLRAHEWSRKAEPQLKGLAKAEVEKRIKELETDLPHRHRAAIAKNAKPSTSAPNFQPPREFQGLLGRVQTGGADAGVLWKYDSGLRISNQSISDILVQAKVARGKLRIEFVGLVFVPESGTVNITHTGGSATGTLTLFVDNKQLGEIGASRATSDVYKVDLNAGEHTIRWILAGDDLGTSSLALTNASSGQPLVAYHNPQLLELVRESPSRARLNVNMLRNP